MESSSKTQSPSLSIRFTEEESIELQGPLINAYNSCILDLPAQNSEPSSEPIFGNQSSPEEKRYQWRISTSKLIVAAGIQLFYLKRLPDLPLSSVNSSNARYKSKQWILAEMALANIPNDGQIISLACSESRGAYPIIALTPKAKDYRQKAYLIFYRAQPNLENVDFSNAYFGLATSQVLTLDFIPFVLKYAKVGGNDHFLLSGNDHKIHTFIRNGESFQEFEHVESLSFPSTFPSSAISFDTALLPSQQQVWAAGCQDGHLVGSETLGLSHFRLDTTASLVRFFSKQATAPAQLFAVHPRVRKQISTSESLEMAPLSIFTTTPDLHLLSMDALGNGFVWRNVHEKGQHARLILPNSKQFDAVLCVCFADIDWDGTNEIILGTYGQELLIYRDCQTHYELCYQKHLARPIVGIHWADLYGQGVPDLIVILTSYVLIFRPDLSLAKTKIETTLKLLIDIIELEHTIQKESQTVDNLTEKLRSIKDDEK